MNERLGPMPEREILAAADMLGRDLPVILVVASNPYARLLDNWLCHADALGRIDRLLLVAMDAELAGRLAGARFPVVRAGFDGSAASFWLERARIWKLLADAGVEFIHSDIDAVWLSDAISPYRDFAFDLLFSQGTRLPDEALKAWGFVLCTGYFWSRPTPGTRSLFDAWLSPPDAILESNDQSALNRLLVGTGTTWDVDGAESYELTVHGRTFRCFREPLAGFCAAHGTRLVLLPHHLFPRLQPGAPDAIVRHVLRNPAPEQRIGLMREAGCWRLDAHPNGYLIAAGH